MGVVRSRCGLSSTLINAPRLLMRSIRFTPSNIDLVALSHDIAASVRCYGSVEIEAASIDEANGIADRLVTHPAGDARFPTLEPDLETFFDYEALNVTPVEKSNT
jgi:hypothetical protein